MKLDDIVLLGFVDEALKYLRNEVKENERPEIEKLVSQLDIEKMKNDLNSKFGSSFIGAEEVIKALMKSGNDAFTDFTEKKKEEEKALNELSDLFDNSFLNDDTKQVQMPKLNIGNLEMENKDEKPQIDLLGFINEIKQKLMKAEEEHKELEIKKEDVDLKEFKDTLTDIIKNELKEDKPEPVKEKVVEEEQEDLPFIQDDDEVYNAIKKAADNKDHFEDEIEDLIQSDTKDVKYDEEVLNQIIDDVNEETKVEENMMYSDAHHNAYVNDLIDDLQKKMEKGLFEATGNEEPKQEVKEEYTPEVHNQYVTNLMKDLQKQIDLEEINRKKLEEAEQVYKEINDVYKHLPRRFVHVVYDARNDIVEGLLDNQRVILLHRAKFEELDNLRQYAEILLTHDFNVNVDEDQMIVDAIKVIDNSEGRIVTNIFEVANQAYLLGGVYDGYRVIKEDDVNI